MAVSAGQSISIDKDVVFARVGGRELLCDVYRPPATESKRTAVVHLHGGGFTRGAKEGARTARALAAAGYVGVASQYRLAHEARWPAQIEDVRSAIRWTCDHAADLDVDPDKIAVLGHSAGGRLALIAAGSADTPAANQGAGTLSSKVAACVAFYAAAGSDWPPRADHPLLGPDADEAAYRSFSPASYLTADYPPTLLLHGTADQTIPVRSSFELYEALTALGVPVELHVVEGVTHIFDAHEEFAAASVAWIDLFLDRHVANPRQIPSTEPAPAAS